MRLHRQETCVRDVRVVQIRIPTALFPVAAVFWRTRGTGHGMACSEITAAIPDRKTATTADHSQNTRRRQDGKEKQDPDAAGPMCSLHLGTSS